MSILTILTQDMNKYQTDVQVIFILHTATHQHDNSYTDHSITKERTKHTSYNIIHVSVLELCEKKTLLQNTSQKLLHKCLYISGWTDIHEVRLVSEALK